MASQLAPAKMKGKLSVTNLKSETFADVTFILRMTEHSVKTCAKVSDFKLVSVNSAKCKDDS